MRENGVIGIRINGVVMDEIVMHGADRVCGMFDIVIVTCVCDLFLRKIIVMCDA